MGRSILLLCLAFCLGACASQKARTEYFKARDALERARMQEAPPSGLSEAETEFRKGAEFMLEEHYEVAKKSFKRSYDLLNSEKTKREETKKSEVNNEETASSKEKETSETVPKKVVEGGERSPASEAESQGQVSETPAARADVSSAPETEATEETKKEEAQTASTEKSISTSSSEIVPSASAPSDRKLEKKSRPAQALAKYLAVKKQKRLQSHQSDKKVGQQIAAENSEGAEVNYAKTSENQKKNATAEVAQSDAMALEKEEIEARAEGATLEAPQVPKISSLVGPPTKAETYGTSESQIQDKVAKSGSSEAKNVVPAQKGEAAKESLKDPRFLEASGPENSIAKNTNPRPKLRRPDEVEKVKESAEEKAPAYEANQKLKSRERGSVKTLSDYEERAQASQVEELEMRKPKNLEETKAEIQFDQIEVERNEKAVDKEIVNRSKVIQAPAKKAVKFPPKTKGQLAAEALQSASDLEKRDEAGEAIKPAEGTTRKIPGSLAFQPNEAALENDVMTNLDQTAKFLLENPSTTLVLSGQIGPQEATSLVDDRFQSIHSYLTGKGVLEDQIQLDPLRRRGKSAQFEMMLKED